MRTPIAFDTHTYVKRLVAAGMPEAQAEVQAEALTEVMLAQLPTKEDLRQAVAELTEKIEGVRSELTGKIEGIRAELTGKIEGIRAELTGKIEGVRTELRGEMREMELRLRAHIESELRKQMIWYFTMQVALVGAVIAVLKLI